MSEKGLSALSAPKTALSETYADVKKGKNMTNIIFLNSQTSLYRALPSTKSQC